MRATRTDQGGRERTAGTAASAYRWLSVLAALLVLVQAVFVGQGLYGGETGAIGVHGWLGNATFLVVTVLGTLAFLGWRGGSGRLGAADFILAAALLLLIVAQLGLGYSGRRNLTAASWHIPNGVLISGVTAAIVARAFAPRGRE